MPRTVKPTKENAKPEPKAESPTQEAEPSEVPSDQRDRDHTEVVPRSGGKGPRSSEVAESDNASVTLRVEPPNARRSVRSKAKGQRGPEPSKVESDARQAEKPAKQPGDKPKTKKPQPKRSVISEFYTGL